MTATNVTAKKSPRVKIAMEVQEELIEHLVYLVPYWINTKLDSAKKDTITYRLSGMMHSLWATFSGSSGGFGPSVDMYPFSTEEEMNARIAEGKNYFPSSVDVSTDINDGGLKYHSAENHVDVPVSSVPPREWDDEEMRSLLFNKIADLLHEAVANNYMSNLDKGGIFLRSVIDLFENGDEDFPKVMLLAVSAPEDKDYYIENGENYYDLEGTQITGQYRSLLDFWDFYWKRMVRQESGLYVAPIDGGSQ